MSVIPEPFTSRPRWLAFNSWVVSVIILRNYAKFYRLYKLCSSPVSPIHGYFPWSWYALVAFSQHTQKREVLEKDINIHVTSEVPLTGKHFLMNDICRWGKFEHLRNRTRSIEHEEIKFGAKEIYARDVTLTRTSSPRQRISTINMEVHALKPLMCTI